MKDCGTLVLFSCLIMVIGLIPVISFLTPAWYESENTRQLFLLHVELLCEKKTFEKRHATQMDAGSEKKTMALQASRLITLAQ